MLDQLREIGQRLAGLRALCDYTVTEMSEKLGISEEEYIQYENGSKDFSFSVLYNCAAIFGVDVLEIMRGESAKLTTCSIVKKGKGFSVKRNEEYDYRHLAYTFKNKKAEPFLVTVERTGTVPTLHAHEGQEFNYVISGKMTLYIGSISYELEEGDSVYFDSGIPHTVQTVDNEPAQFLAVVMK